MTFYAVLNFGVVMRGFYNKPDAIDYVEKHGGIIKEIKE